VSSRGKLALVAIAVIGVVLGLWLGFCGRTSTGSHDAGVVIAVDAGQVAMLEPPKIVDAGTVAIAPVDAGEAPSAEMPLVAPQVRGHRESSSGGAHQKIVRAETPKPEKPKEEPKPKEPEVHDAGTVVAAVVDAGTAPPAATKIARVDMQPDAMPSDPITIAYTDQLSTWLKLTQVRVFVDGKRVADEHNVNGIDLTKSRVLYSGGVFPGAHQVRVESVYFGKGNGVFSYMEGYRFRVPQMTVVQVPDGKKLRVDAVAYDKGALEQWENRPAMKLDVKVE
jgi:hypothetical protein